MTFDEAKIAAGNGSKIRHRTWKTIKHIRRTAMNPVWTVSSGNTELGVPENIFNILYLGNTPLDNGWEIVE